MKESKTAYILLGIGITMIVVGFGILGVRIQKEAYCSSLEIQEYLEQRDYCKEYVER